jgi:hypothetical protein
MFGAVCKQRVHLAKREQAFFFALSVERTTMRIFRGYGLNVREKHIRLWYCAFHTPFRVRQKTVQVCEMQPESSAVVLDVGSHQVKAGFAGDDAPRCVFPTVVGFDESEQKYYVGDVAQSRRSRLRLDRPVQGGRVANWDELEKLLHDTFYSELRVSPEEYSLLMSEVPLNPKSDREKLTELAFETFNVASFYLSNSAALAAASMGTSTALIVNCGHEATHTVAVHQGHALAHTTRSFPISGKRSFARSLVRSFARSLVRQLTFLKR